MIKTETAKELVNQEENLSTVLNLKKCVEKGVEVSVIAIDYDSKGREKEYCILPSKDLILPFLEECKKFCVDRIEALNNQAREELNADKNCRV